METMLIITIWHISGKGMGAVKTKSVA